MAFIRPSFIDNMGYHMGEVYGAITDQILINLARYFPYWTESTVPKSAFEYQATMLAQMGQVNAETVQILRNGLKGGNAALKNILEQAIMESVKKSFPELLKGVQNGIFNPATIPVLAPNQMQAFQFYYQQAAQKLNLVNTVMLESTRQAYQNTVADIVTRVQASQVALDVGAGEVVTGVSSWNQAMVHSINRMKENGITGFIDHAGHRWSAEAYTSMDIRTTVANTARAAVWETNQSFGNDLYLVSFHNGARPLCYPWQNKVISANDNAGVTYDLDGNEIIVIRQSDTSYGEPAGLFGINCKHYPTPFIPGVSVIYGQPQDKDENDRVYAESQQQRALERKIREEKRDLLMMKAQGNVPDEVIKAQRAKIRQTDDDIDAFCEKTGRARRQNREGVYTKREFPDPQTYDVTTFERTQKDEIDKFFADGGAQQGYTFGTMTPSEPITPAPKPAPVVPSTPVTPIAPVTPVPQNVAPQATPTRQNVVQSNNAEKSEFLKRLERQNIQRVPVATYATQPTETEIIDKIAGADKTKGSCSSCALAYAANKNGLDVTDFRGGMSQNAFSAMNNIKTLLDLDGVEGKLVKGGNDFTNAHELLKEVQEGKEYYFTAGKHAAIVRKTETGIEYLEMQSGWRKNTWYELNDFELKNRFGCKKSHTTYGMKYETSEVIFDIATTKGNKDFEELMQFINTDAGRQMKGIGGGEK